jgi:hypothetical protein
MEGQSWACQRVSEKFQQEMALSHFQNHHGTVWPCYDSVIVIFGFKEYLWSHESFLCSPAAVTDNSRVYGSHFSLPVGLIRPFTTNLGHTYSKRWLWEFWPMKRRWVQENWLFHDLQWALHTLKSENLDLRLFHHVPLETFVLYSSCVRV